jgi:serine/threonine protein kinase/tetratricopeptide (TPR) repeat protein
LVKGRAAIYHPKADRMPPTPANAALHPLLRENEGERRLGPFRLLRKLGQGGFAPVWLAEESYDGKRLREVALKLFFLPATIAGDADEARRWREAILEEARALCRVEHPNVVRFHSLHQDEAGSVVALSMEYVAGESLDLRLTREGRLDERTVIEAGIAIAWALAAVHQAGLVHRDIKPANVVQGAAGYKLLDFGIVVSDRSREPGAGVTAGGIASSAHPERAIHAPTGGVLQATLAVGPTGEPDPSSASWLDPTDASQPLVGTLGFIAPECFFGAPASPASDLYALGATLFTLLVGQLPAEAALVVSATRRLAVPLSIPRGPVPRIDRLLPGRSAATPALAELVALLLDENPDARPRYADWVARELEQLRASILSPEELLAVAPRSSLIPPAPVARPREPAPREAVPRGEPRLPQAFADPPLIGRDEVIALLDRASAGVRDEPPVRSVVLLSGPLGIGRTRLLDVAVERAALPSSRVLRARCSPERQSPFGPLHRALAAQLADGTLGLARLEDALQRALSPGRSPSEHEASRAVEGVEDALLRASEREPLLVVIDDLQWADAHTLELCRLLIERAGGEGAGRLLLLLAMRDEPSPRAPLRALLGRMRGRARPGVSHVALRPLSDEETARLAQAMSPISSEIEQALVRGSGGVPFFVVHALLGWAETSAIAWSRGALRPVGNVVLRGEVPGVADLLETRIEAYFEPGSLGERAALRALAAVALYGGGLGMELLLGATGDPDAVEGALETLISLGILTVSGDRHEVSFAQEMVRQAALNLLRPRSWFFRLHRALLDTLARREGAEADATFLATGYEKLGDAVEAKRWLACAFERATFAGLFVEAAELGDRLAALTADPHARTGLALDVIKALIQGRRFEDARARLAKIEQGGAPHAGEAGRVLDLRRRVQRLEVARGLREPAPLDPALPSDAAALGDRVLHCEALMALAGVERQDRALSLATEAVARSEGLGDTTELAARVRRFELNYTSNHSDLALAEDDLRRALALAARASSVFQQVHIEGDLAIVEAELGRLDAAIERLTHLAEQAEAQGMRGQLRLFLQNLSALLLRADRDAEAAETARRTAELAADAGDTVLRAVALSLRARALQRTGDLEAALRAVDEAERLQRARGDRSRALTLLRRAEILEAQGRPSDALADAREAKQVAQQHDDRDLVLGSSLWISLHLARRGLGTREAVELALAEAQRAEVTLRVPTKLLMDQARAWLSTAGPTLAL